MKKTAFLIFFILSNNFAIAAYYNNGNSYSSSSQNGQTNVQGYNSNTGSNWNTTIEKNGNMSGVDSKGNTWSYDHSTGNYSNSNGKYCTGHGASRVCN